VPLTAHRVKLVRDVAAGDFVTAADVALDENAQAVRIRREMESRARDAIKLAASTLAVAH
jgi:predicted homoserine dehydrogenase-like protein